MRNTPSLLSPSVLTLVLGCHLCMACLVPAADSWPQWRGAHQDGVATGQGYPKSWSESQSVLWNKELPGRGGSTPVIHGDTLYLTCGVDGKNTIVAMDAGRGEQKWMTAVGEDTGGKHKKGSGSNPSCVADEKSVFAYFRSGDLGCVDHAGKLLWHVNLQEQFGEDTLWWDLGSSPLLTDDAVIVAVMQTGPSYLVALKKETGDVLWKTDRQLGAPKEAAQSYSTPLAVTVNQQPAIAVMGADHLTLHSADDGKEIGRLGGFNPEANGFFRSISSPIAQGNLIVCPYARGATVTTVNMDDLAAGKSEDAIVWFRDDLGSDVPTPAASGGHLYVVGDGKQNRGDVSCVELTSGKTIWTVSLPKSRLGFSSSPLVAGDHLYVTREDAATFVIGPLSSDRPKLVSQNEVADNQQYTVASPVPYDASLLLRTRNRLYRLGAR